MRQFERFKYIPIFEIIFVMNSQTILIIILTNIISISLVIIIYLLIKNRGFSAQTTGFTLGPYRNLIILSEKGGMAKIYKAQNSQTGEECIIKVLRQELAGDEEVVKKFIREGEILKKIKREAPDAPIPFFRRSGTIRTGLSELPFIELEYIEGIDLSEAIARKKFTEEEVEVLAYKILKGLKEAHSIGAIHRDIKPQNIILREGKAGEPVIIDFGVAKDITSKSVTAGGYGTASYMSPEQVSGEAVTEKTDIYSLGVVLYECLSGEKPFEGESPFEVMRKQREEAPDTSKLKGVSERVKDIILEMLTKDPEGRPSVEELMGRIREEVKTGKIKLEKVEFKKESVGRKRVNLIKPVAIGVLISAILIPIIITIKSKERGDGIKREGVREGSNLEQKERIAEDIIKEAEVMLSYKDIEGAEKKIKAYKELRIDYLKEKEYEIKEKIIKIKEDLIKEAEEKAKKEAEAIAKKIKEEEERKREEEEKKHSSMVYIKGGGFFMGCTEGDGECDSDEHPRHYVNVNSFWMDRYEVTASEYRKCVESGKCSKPGPDENCNWGKGRDNHPINCVSLDQAKTYCEWMGKRLPTEAEWEYAARGGRNDWIYPWGNDISHNNANYLGVEGRDQWEDTSPIGSFDPNGFGLYDMAGNVWEWVEDCENGRYNGAPVDGSAWLSGDCRWRVFRGGSWDYDPRFLRVSDRYWWNQSVRDSYFGFRCARTN